MRDLTLNERTRIVEIFNNAMEGTSYPQRITLDSVPEHLILGHKGLLDLGDYFNQIDPDRMEDPFFQIFNGFSIDKKGEAFSCYHFKRLDRGLQLLKSKSIALNTLFSNKENDYAEFEEFFRRYGPLHNLIPNNYQPPGPGDFPVIVSNDRPVDALKNSIFVTCFTQTYDDQRFWNDYALNNGLCFRFRFYDYRTDIIQNFGELKRNVQHLYQLREVAYDNDGYMYDFLNEINYRLGQEFGLTLFCRGLPIAAQFYKRPRYTWENEIRLAIDLEFVEVRYAFPLRNHLKLIETENRRTILLPIAEALKSPFFGIELQDVFCSKGLEDVEKVREIVKLYFPNANFWEYKEWSKKLPYKD